MDNYIDSNAKQTAPKPYNSRKNYRVLHFKNSGDFALNKIADIQYHASYNIKLHRAKSTTQMQSQTYLQWTTHIQYRVIMQKKLKKGGIQIKHRDKVRIKDEKHTKKHGRKQINEQQSKKGKHQT